MLSTILGLGFFAIVLAFIIAFVPAIIAFKRDHAYKWIILALCFFSATGILWLVAMIWAVWPADKSLADPVLGNVTGKGNRNVGHTLGEVSHAKNSVGKQATKECPDCAEEVAVNARVCKHCGYKFTAAKKPAAKKVAAKKPVRVEPVLAPVVEPVVKPVAKRAAKSAAKPVAKREKIEATEPTFVDLMN